MAILPSYDSFFSSYSRKPERGYSGTCIFTNRSTCVPVRAEEGLSGLLPVEQQRGTRSGEKAEGFIEGALSNETIALNMADVKTIDLEGRTTMVDMGLFVLINMYCPNETNEERLDFKLAFNAMMEARILGLISAGREVIAVGDFNICAKVIDHCDPVKRANDHPAYGAFENHPARKWFNQFVTSDPAKELFSNGGTARMVDLGRYFYPDRKGMFSHWETRINARETNYGTRLDYIICTPGLLPWVKTCEVQNSILGSDHCPVVADFHDSITDAEGTVHGLWEAINPPGRKSGEEVEPPRLAARNYPEFGKEQKLLSTFFGKKSAKAESPVVSEPAATTSTSSAVPLSSPIALSTHASETALETAQAASSSNVNGVSALPSRPPLVPSHSSSTISQQASKSAQSVPQSPSIDLTLHDEEEEGEEQEVVAGPSRSRQPDASASTSKRKREKEPLVSRSPSVSISSNERRESSLVPSVGKKKTKGQQTIASFFKPPAPPASSSTEMKKDRKGKGKAKTQEEDASVGATTSGENRVEGVALSSNSSKETEDDDELQVVEGSTPSAENVNGKPKKRDSAVAPVKYTDEDIDEEDEDDIRMVLSKLLLRYSGFHVGHWLMFAFRSCRLWIHHFHPRTASTTPRLHRPGRRSSAQRYLRSVRDIRNQPSNGPSISVSAQHAYSTCHFRLTIVLSCLSWHQQRQGFLAVPAAHRRRLRQGPVERQGESGVPV